MKISKTYEKAFPLKFGLFVFVTCLLFAVSCQEEKSCFDEQLYQQNKDNFCTTDCPGVVGCDGKTYCNECEANRQGIRIVK